VISQEKQTPNAIVLVRPHQFRPNPDTVLDNLFQSAPGSMPLEVTAREAREAVDRLAATLERLGIEVLVFDDVTDETPDSVYPNNWMSTHGDGTLMLYPMFVANRRFERRMDIVEALQSQFIIERIGDISHLELSDRFLEGTGSMVLDRPGRVAYAALSKRTDPSAFEAWCKAMAYTPVPFMAKDDAGVPIYHTNVMMSVAREFAMIGSSLIRNEAERKTVLDWLSGANGLARARRVVDLTAQQISKFAGNTLEVNAKHGPALLISETAYGSLKKDQIALLEQSVEIVPVDVATVERGGGSIRCMMADIYLEPTDQDDRCFVKGIG